MPQGIDCAREVTVAVIDIARAAMSESKVYRTFAPRHRLHPLDRLELGCSVLAVGFPLALHGALHHMPVVRQAVVASSFGLRFQGHGDFLTDIRNRRGTSCSSAVMCASERLLPYGNLPWILSDVLSAQFDAGTRDFC